MSLGIRRTESAVPELETALASDPDSIVRSQAAIALGQIGKAGTSAALERASKHDKDRDVIHQAKLSLHALKTNQPATPALASAWKSLDTATFATAKVGQTAPDFTLPDTNGKRWKLSDFRGKQAVALIWIFADWCPVCHGEFREIIELKDEFIKAGIQPVTLECHDHFRARVMVGKELDPEYWFAKKSFRESYTEKIWWPHLVDRAAVVGVQYDIQPMAFAVHAEFINRPTVALVDKEGILRFLYQGTFWGDRPSIHEVLEMMKSGDFSYPEPKRLKPAKP
jgi:alkyl hydroperoxide reductase subunit AhpC